MNILFAIPILISAVFGLLGTTLLVIGIASRNKAVSADQWPTVSGRVIQSEATSDGPRIVYEYNVKGITYTGRRVRFGEQTFTEAQAQSVAARYPAGRNVTVHYNRAHPEDSVLEIQVSATRILLAVGGALLIIAMMSFCMVGYGLLARG